MFPHHYKFLITGATSIHGWPLFKKLESIVGQGRIIGIRSPKMQLPKGDNLRSICITDTQAFMHLRDTFSPTHVIHAAGVCDLDVCEERPQWAHTMNVSGTETIASVFGQFAHVTYLSTDLVFSGNNPPVGGYSEEDTPDPLSIAGKTFAQAEAFINRCAHSCIIRLGLPIGRSANGDKGAVDFIESRFRRNLCMTLFHDEIRSCISCVTIAEVVCQMIERAASGLFHCGADKPCSLYDVGMDVLRQGNYAPHLLNSISRFEEKNGPPRIGTVTMNSGKIKNFLGIATLA